MKWPLLVVAFVAISVYGAHEPQRCSFASGGLNDPFSRFVRIGNVECGKERPKNAQNVFWRSANEMAVDVVASDAPPTEMVPEAKLILVTPLQKNERLAVYVPRTAAMLPVEIRDSRATVPAETEIVPLVIVASRKIVAVGDAVTLRRDEERRITVDRDAPAFLSWIQYRGASAKALGTPRVVLRSKNGREVKPLVRVSAAEAHGAMPLLIVRAPRGTYELILDGEGWMRVGREVTIDGVVTDERPLVASPRRSLTVRLDVVNDPRGLYRDAAADCLADRKRDDAPGVPTFVLEECDALAPSMRPNMVDRDSCRVVDRKEVDLDAKQPTLVFEDVAYGPYIGSFRAPGVPPVEEVLVVGASDVERFVIRYSRVFGRITRGGRAVAAQLEAAGGHAFSDADTGDYEMIVRDQRAVREGGSVTVCGEKSAYYFYPEVDVHEGERFDIDIPTSSIEVHVTDAESHGDIAGAEVSYSILRPDSDRAAELSGEWGETDSQGLLPIASPPPNRRVTLCATRRDYESKCSAAFSVKRDEQRRIELPLPHTNVLHGRVTNAPAADFTELVFFDGKGGLSEFAAMNADGSFDFKHRHDGEWVSVVSPVLPVAVLPVPRTEDGAITLTIPAAPIRRYEISLGADSDIDDAFVTVAIGDIIVPGNVFGFFQQRRGLQTALGRRDVSSFTIPAVLETAPITILALPIVAGRQLDFRTDSDLFYAPGNQPFIRRKSGDEMYVVW